MNILMIRDVDKAILRLIILKWNIIHDVNAQFVSQFNCLGSKMRVRNNNCILTSIIPGTGVDFLNCFVAYGSCVILTLKCIFNVIFYRNKVYALITRDRRCMNLLIS